MRVLILSTWFPYPPDNGAKIRAHYLIRALSDKHDVTLATFCTDSIAETAKPARVEVITVPDDPFRHVNKPQIVKYVSPIPLAFWPSHAMQQAINQIAARRHFDVVVAIQTPVARYAAALHDIPRVIDIDTSFSFQMLRRSEHYRDAGTRLRTWISWQKTRWYEQHIFREFLACTVSSSLEVDFVATMIKDHGGSIEVIRNGVDCEQFQPGRYPVRPNTLIYNGALTYSANYDAMQYFLSTIYPLIRKEVGEATLTITGSNTGVNLNGLLLNDSVKLPGHIADIRPYVGSSAVCVVPLRQGSGTRLKILEAMALGVPVVSTSKGAEGLDAIDGQHLLLADDPAEFAFKTGLLLQDVALRQRLISQARQLVEQRYDWRDIGQTFVNLVEAVVDKGKISRL